MGPHGRTLSVLASILGVVLLSSAFVADAQSIGINFVAAAGPVPVGGYLQFTTLLLANRTAASTVANVTLSVTCSDSLIIVPGATVLSPGCTTPVRSPPYPAGYPVGGPYPGCDSKPLGLVDLTRSTPASGPTYPTTVSADGHSAIWKNVILPVGATAPSALPFLGLVNYYQPILCLATVTPSNSSAVILNSVVGVTGLSKNYLKEGLVYTNIIPPPPSPPGPPGSAPVTSAQTAVPTSGTTLATNIVFVPTTPATPTCIPGNVSAISNSNTTAPVGNATVCTTTISQTVTNTTTCVAGGSNVLVNTTTTTLVTCLPVPVVDPLLPNVTTIPTPTPIFNGTGTPIPTPIFNGTGTPTPTPTGTGTGTPTPTPTLPGATTPIPILPGATTPVPTLPGATTPVPTLPGATTPVPTLPGVTTGVPVPTTGVPVPTATDLPVPTTGVPVPTTDLPVSTTGVPLPTPAQTDAPPAPLAPGFPNPTPGDTPSQAPLAPGFPIPTPPPASP